MSRTIMIDSKGGDVDESSYTGRNIWKIITK